VTRLSRRTATGPAAFPPPPGGGAPLARGCRHAKETQPASRLASPPPALQRRRLLRLLRPDWDSGRKVGDREPSATGQRGWSRQRAISLKEAGRMPTFHEGLPQWIDPTGARCLVRKTTVFPTPWQSTQAAPELGLELSGNAPGNLPSAKRCRQTRYSSCQMVFSGALRLHRGAASQSAPSPAPVPSPRM
jgi:hypothetical protein